MYMDPFKEQWQYCRHKNVQYDFLTEQCLTFKVAYNRNMACLVRPDSMARISAWITVIMMDAQYICFISVIGQY